MSCGKMFGIFVFESTGFSVFKNSPDSKFTSFSVLFSSTIPFDELKLLLFGCFLFIFYVGCSAFKWVDAVYFLRYILRNCCRH